MPGRRRGTRQAPPPLKGKTWSSPASSTQGSAQPLGAAGSGSGRGARPANKLTTPVTPSPSCALGAWRATSKPPEKCPGSWIKRHLTELVLSLGTEISNSLQREPIFFFQTLCRLLLCVVCLWTSAATKRRRRRRHNLKNQHAHALCNNAAAHHDGHYRREPGVLQVRLFPFLPDMQILSVLFC